ncbi:MAG: hypothetical protein ACTHM9_02140 [Gemmatimonadales bacterium]
MIRTAGAAVLALVALAHPLHAQAERWQVTLEGDRYVWDVSLVALDGRHLLVRQSDSMVRVPVAKMTELRLIQKSQAEVGRGGAMAGAMSALVGGDDEVHDLRALDLAARLDTIRAVLKTHPPEPAEP